jgi:hypothetical protein
MKLLALLLATALTAAAQQPPAAADAFRNLVSQPAQHTAFTFDHDMISGFLNDQTEAGRRVAAELNSITFETFHYHEPAFYTPEGMSAIYAAYNAAGWKHLVDQRATAAQSASPGHPLTDLWLHFHGSEIDNVTVLIRAPHEMSLVEVTGDLRPLDLVHLGGKFGIPRVDPNAVMVPAPPGR